MQSNDDNVGKLPDLAELADRLAIQEVLAVHCRGVDRADARILKSAYWADAEVAYGGFEGAAHEFCELLPKSLQRFARTHHAISNTLIAFLSDGATREGREAVVETYVTAQHYLAAEESSQATPDSEMTFFGRYFDRFQLRDSSWKIRHRRVLMDWNQNTEASALWVGPPFDGLTRGGRFPDDPLYAVLEAAGV